MATKSAPLETFLTTVSPRGPEAHEQRKVDSDSGEGARAVILTILAKESPLKDDALRPRSELNTDLYASTLDELVAHGLIQRGDDGYVLTPLGQKAAEEQRARLLSF